MRRSGPPNSRPIGRSGTSIRPIGLPDAVVDEDLPVGDVDVARRCPRRRSRRRARRTAVRSPSVPSGLHGRAVGPVLGAAGDVDALPGQRRDAGRRRRGCATSASPCRPCPDTSRPGPAGTRARPAGTGCRRATRTPAASALVDVAREHLRERRVLVGVEIELVRELAVVPHVDGQDRRRARVRRAGCGCEHGELVGRRVGPERVDRAFRPGRRQRRAGCPTCRRRGSPDRAARRGRRPGRAPRDHEKIRCWWRSTK